MRVVLLLLLLSGPSFLVAQTYTVPGRAYDLKSNKLAFTIKHIQRFEGQELVHDQMLSDTPDGRPSFRRDFDRKARTVDAKNLLTGEAYSTRQTGQTFWIKHKKGSGAKVRSVEKTARGQAYLSPELSSVIQIHWDALVEGKDVVFAIPAASQLDWFRFRFRKKRTYVDNKDRNIIEFIFEPQSPFIRLFAGKMYMRIDTKSRGMVEYEGPMPQTDQDGNAYKVRIVYGGLGVGVPQKAAPQSPLGAVPN